MPWQLALVISLICVKALISETGRRLLLDRPNDRSPHGRPLSSTGGVAIAAGERVHWLVTGATGSSSSDLCRQIARPAPQVVFRAATFRRVPL